MPVNKLFGDTYNLLSQALQLRSQRQELIQSNIANMETPGYRAQDLDFAELMRAAVSQQGKMASTHEAHIAAAMGDGSATIASVHSKGAVDIDEEMVSLAENQLMYETATNIISRKFSGMKYIIDEGGK